MLDFSAFLSCLWLSIPYIHLMIAAAGILYAFEHSEPAGKAVLLFLLLGSIFSWSVIWSKWVQLNAVLKSTRAFLPIYFPRINLLK